LLHWGTGAPRVEQLRARGVLVLEWAAWRRETAGWLRPGAHDDRQTLEPPGCTRLAELRDKEAVAVLGVELASLDDVRCLHETLLVPVLRAGMPLLVESERTPEELDDAAFVEPGFEHAATLERMRWLCARARDGDVGFARVSTQPPHRSLDDAQLAAARAPGGVVQVIAPAGSGKTTVLIERVRELLARSADPDRILCMTFNDAAAAELRERLERPARVASPRAPSIRLGIGSFARTGWSRAARCTRRAGRSRSGHGSAAWPPSRSARRRRKPLSCRMSWPRSGSASSLLRRSGSARARATTTAAASRASTRSLSARRIAGGCMTSTT
jgi:hypothetical protein